MPFESEAQRGFMFANHPKIAKRFEKETPEDADLPEYVPHLNQGDIIGGFSQDPLLQPQMPFQPPTPDQETGFDAQSGLPKPTPQIPASPVAPPVNDLSPFLDQQRAAMDKYGPDQQMAVEQAIQKSRGGLAQTAGNAMTGFADALMQGVARAGPGNFQQNLENRNQQTEAGIRGAMERAQSGTMAQMKQQMELAQMDPNSSLSKMAQKAYGATLKSMPGGQGLTDAQISAIPASVISDILGKKVDLAKALAEVQNTEAYRDATLAIQRGAQAESIRHAKTEENIAKGAKQSDAARTLAGRGVWRRATDALTNNPAVQVLQQQASGYEPDVLQYAQTHGITPQAAQAQKDRRTGGQ